MNGIGNSLIELAKEPIEGIYVNYNIKSDMVKTLQDDVAAHVLDVVVDAPVTRALMRSDQTSLALAGACYVAEKSLQPLKQAIKEG